MRKIYLVPSLLLGTVAILTAGLFYARQWPQQTSSISKPKQSSTSSNTVNRIAPLWSINLKDVNDIGVSQDRKLLVVGTGKMEGSTRSGTPGQIQVWNLEKRTFLHTFHDPKFINDVAISPDIKSILSCNATSIVKQWSIVQKKVVREYNDPDGSRVFFIEISPNGRWLATSLGSAVRLWDLMTGKVIRTIRLDGEGHIYDLKFSPTGKELGIGRSWYQLNFWVGEKQVRLGSQKTQTHGNSRIYDVMRTGVFKSFGGKEKAVLNIAFSPDGKQFASLDHKGKLQFWDIASGTLRKSLSQNKEPIIHFAYSNDGRWLATTHKKANTVKIWSTHTWTVRYLLEGKGKPVWGVYFAQIKDDTLVVIGRTGEQIITWHVTTEH